MSVLHSYRMRNRRKYARMRAWRRHYSLDSVSDQTHQINKGDVLLCCTLRDEKIRLPYFLQYYRDMGVSHFLIVDNGSADGSAEYLAEQPDVSLWSTTASYKKSRFGVDWVNWLLRKYAHGHWALVVDPDEFFVYPFCDTRPIRALTDWLDVSHVRSFSAMLLDMYPKGSIELATYSPGQNPLEVTPWFDPGNYVVEKNPFYGNLWIQGGARARMFFQDNPQKAPALNKVPLVKWDRRYAYVSSTHMLLPRGLNKTYDEWGGEKASGILLHTKFLNMFPEKAKEELARKQHYGASVEYKAYAEKVQQEPDMWCKWSEKYINWRQLEILGLMSKGNWA